MKSVYKSCLDNEIDYPEPNLDDLIDAELAEEAFNSHIDELSQAISEMFDGDLDI